MARGNAQAKQPKGQVIAVLNMKGGVGKTTITANVFRQFYLHKGKRVLLIDFDPQFNLSQTVFTQAIYERLKKEKRTILAVMEDTSEPSLYDTGKHSRPVPAPADLACKLKYRPDHPTAKLDLIAGDFDMVKFSLENSNSVLKAAKQRFVSFLGMAQAEYDLICIDCNPSSTFMTTCAISVSTHILVPVKPDRYSILGLKMLDTFVDRLTDIVKKPEKIVLLNGVPKSNYDPEVENALRSDPVFGPQTLASSLYETTLLNARPNYTGFATDKKIAHSKVLKANIAKIVNELHDALGMS
ncbi:ParA family protein [Herbaspirillum seropedicae]|uniref:ParA family protein n=1 Tax=Herbaspirillum seropedicae TaxID=964 RepID=UPI00111EDF13|nr:ParA family protein [Herbaspirillum seropedicae]QDD65523.1 ParA family protein [Herbaspirillum seropedicae]